MVDAVLAYAAVERVAELASDYVGRPVVIVVPERGIETASADDAELVTPIKLGGVEIGLVAMLHGKGPARVEAAEVLHLAALATVTGLALEEARAEQSPAQAADGLIEDLRSGALSESDLVRRAARLGRDLTRGAVVLVTEMCSQRPREAMAVIASEYPEALTELLDGRVYAVMPARGGEGGPEVTVKSAAALVGRLRSYGWTGFSSYYQEPTDLRRAIQEAEFVLDVVARDERMADELGGGASSGVYRLLFRALASDPTEVRSFYEDTVAPVIRYDDQYQTDLLSTLEAYLANDCNMNATAREIYAHRHTVAYRLQRVRELTGLDPMISEERERLGLGLKAYRIVAPTLPR
jgi:sugar diacid utilization regulator